MSIVDRLNELLNFSGLSVRSFSMKCNISQPTLDKQLKGLRGVSTETLVNVLHTFPQVSAEWLLRGEGTMFKDTTPLEVMEAKANEALAKVVSSYQEMLDVKNERIAKLEEENRQLKAQVK